MIGLFVSIFWLCFELGFVMFGLGLILSWASEVLAVMSGFGSTVLMFFYFL